MLAGNPSPHVSTRVEAVRNTSTTSLLLVLFHDALYFLLDIRKCFKGNIRDLVFQAVFFELQSFTAKEDICLSGCCKIRHTIADEYDKRDFAIAAGFSGFSTGFVN